MSERPTSISMARSTPQPQYLYVVEIGEYVKVGITSQVERRFQQLADAARTFDLHYEPLMFLEPHTEARENEGAVLREFRSAGSCSEYLNADSAAVLRFVCGLPQTAAAPVQGGRP